MDALATGRADYAYHDAMDERRRHYLWVRRGHIVHTVGEDWGIPELDDWWDAGIPVGLWDSDGWEMGKG